MTADVFVTRDIPEAGLDIIREHYSTDVWEDEGPPSQETIMERAERCIGLVTLLSDRITAPVMDALPRLRAIAQYAVGYDNIDIEAATRRGIIVTNTPGVLTETTADLTWALLMATARRVVEADRYVRTGQWKVAWGPKMLLGVDVHGATLGIIGMGRIGAAVARRATGFGMKVIYTSRHETKTTRQVEAETGAERRELPELLSEADFVSIHVPLTEETRGMIGADEIRRMKAGAVLVNTSRGAVVDERALVEALKTGHLRAAGLDVFESEPLGQDSPLLSLPNVVLTPHVGSASVATRTKMATLCAENLIAALSGRVPPNIVNPEAMDIHRKVSDSGQ